MKRISPSSRPCMENLEDRRLLSLTYITGAYTGSLSISHGPTYTIVLDVTGEDRRGILEGKVLVYTSKTNFDTFPFSGRLSGASFSASVPAEKTDLAGTVNTKTGVISGTAKETSGGHSGTFSVKYHRR